MFDLSLLNVFDYILLTLLLLSLIIGLFRGFIRELISLLSWLLAFTLSILFAQNLSLFLQQYIKTQHLAHIVSFFIIFLGTLIAGALVNVIVRYFVFSWRASISNHILGALFGFVRGFLLISFVVLLVSITAWKGTDWFQNSQLATFLQPPIKWIVQRVDVSLSDDAISPSDTTASSVSHVVQEIKDRANFNAEAAEEGYQS